MCLSVRYECICVLNEIRGTEERAADASFGKTNGVISLDLIIEMR